MDASSGMGIGPKVPLHHKEMETAVFGAVTDSCPNINSHVYTTGEGLEGARKPKFSVDISQPSPSPDTPFQNPYALTAIEVGGHHQGIITGNNGPQVDNIPGKFDPAEAVATSSPSSKDDLPPHYKSYRRFSCPQQGCKITATSQKDIDRHIRSIHSQGLDDRGRIMCPVGGCPKAKTGFARRDHYIRHMEGLHKIMVGREKRGRKRTVHS